MRQFGLIQQECCVFCGEACEHRNHLLFECPFTARGWAVIKAKGLIQSSAMAWGDLVQWYNGVLQVLSMSTGVRGIEGWKPGRVDLKISCSKKFLIQ